MAESSPEPGILRRHDLDALRATAMLLGIVLHAGLAYVTFPFWPVRDAHTHVFFDVMNSAVHGFRMPLFFMISGFFTAMLWRKRGLGALLKHRAKRVLLPFVVLLIPIQGLTIGTAILVSRHEIAASRRLSDHGDRHSASSDKDSLKSDEESHGKSANAGLGAFTERYRAFIRWPGFRRPMILGHLWFLYFLCIILVPFAMWALIAERLDWRGSPEWLLRSPGVFLWLVPLTMIPQWFNGLLYPSFGPDTSLGVVPYPQGIALYLIYFFVGAAYFDCEVGERTLGRIWWVLIPLALLVVFPVGMLALHEPDALARYVPEGSIRFVAVLAQALYAWLMIFGLIGLFKRICSKENRIIRYLSDSSYWLYLAHIPLLFVLQAMLVPLDVSAFVKMPLVCLLSTGILLLSYRLLVRYTWLGRMLNGRRDREAS